MITNRFNSMLLKSIDLKGGIGIAPVDKRHMNRHKQVLDPNLDFMKVFKILLANRKQRF